ncbi:MAG: hypothetical protein IJ124_14565 [Clostridia bacterium]|nr:hypothetical protein [Clostridia bacterium]
MRNRLTSLLFHILFGKEAEEMMAMLWAQKIMSADTIEEARALYMRVPRLLKEKVKAILTESGMEELIVE